jgi:hypothetical protein
MRKFGIRLSALLLGLAVAFGTFGLIPAHAAQPTFPIQGAFYYPWFPETWGDGTHYHPTLGQYDSSSKAVIDQHIAWMQQAGLDMGIASWWGPGSKTDSRIPALEVSAVGTGFKWTLYYEQEGYQDPSSTQIKSDLAYIRSHYVKNHPQFLRVSGKPVIFVYAAGNDACGMSSRWAGNPGFYVVLKVFSGFTGCANQPDSWHQYAPASAEQVHLPWSFVISPGFWKSTEATPRLGRDLARWRSDVSAMLTSGADWQLITTFNEWGEGTAIEPANEWGTGYLDALTSRQMGGG